MVSLNIFVSKKNKFDNTYLAYLYFKYYVHIYEKKKIDCTYRYTYCDT